MVLTLMTGIFGGAPLRVLRRIVGPLVFWVLAAALTSVFWSLGWKAIAGFFLAQFLVIGIYAEFEDRDLNSATAGILSLTLSSLFLSSGLYFWAALSSVSVGNLLNSAATNLKSRMEELKISGVMEAVTAEQIVYQIPSILIVLLTLSLAISLIAEKNFSRWLKVNYRKRERLSDFKIPGPTIWVFIFSLLGAFANHGQTWLQVVCSNVLNVTVGFYFLQGLAVVGKSFIAFRIGFLWRVIWILVFVIQLPLVVSLIGIADYWVEFRRHILKKSAKLKKSV